MKLRKALPMLTLVAIGFFIKRIPGERSTNIGAIEDEALAQDYQRLTETPQFALIHGLVARRALDADFTGKAIDIGGGPGKLAIRMALRAPRAEVISLDPAQKMVDLANQRAAEAGVDQRVTGALGSSERIPFPDEHFDLVVSTLSLHHWDDPVAALREIKRVLKPSGRLLIVDLRRDLALSPWLFVSIVQRVIPFAALRRAGEPVNSVKSGYTPDEVMALLGLAGIANWRVTGGPAWLTIERSTGPRRSCSGF